MTAIPNSPSGISYLEFAAMPNRKKKKMPDPLAREMGTRLKRARDARGLTQDQLAKMASAGTGTRLGQTAIANFESGTRRIRRDAALALEKVLGMPAGYFLCILDEEEAAIISAVREHRGIPRFRKPPNNGK